MTAPVQQKTPQPAAQPELKLPNAAAPSAAADPISAITSSISTLSSLLKMPAPIKKSPETEHKPEESEPEKAKSTEEKQSLLSFVAEKAAGAMKWAGEKATGLAKCRSWSDLANWGKELVREAIDGLSSTFKEFRQIVETSAAERTPAPPEQATQFTDMLSTMVAQAEEQKFEQKRKAQEEVSWERAHKVHHETETAEVREVEHLTRLSPKFADRKDIAELKIAITRNHIPTEDMVQVRRFLAQVAEEEKEKQSG